MIDHMRKRYIVPVIAAVICWSGAKAQNDALPSRTLTIEGAYNPSMSEQGKIMPVPGRPQTERQAAAVSYRTEANPHQAWDYPGKNTRVGCHFLLQCMKVKSESEVAQSCPTLATPWTAAYQAPPSMGFSGQQYWSGVPLPSPQ